MERATENADLSGAPPTPSKEMPDKPSRELPPAENSTSGPSMEETVPMKSNMNIPMIEEPEQATTVPGPSKEPQLLGKDSPSEEAPNTERKKWNVKIRTWHATNGDTPGRVGVDIVVVSLYNSSMATEERPDADFRLFEPPDADFPQSSDEDREDIPFNDFLYQTQKVFAAESPSPSAPKTPVTLEEDPLADLKVTKGNWLKNPEMLPKYFPNARITTMAYDVYGRGDLPMDISRASEQLREYLSSIKIERPHRHELWQTWDFPVPIVFIGHGYGESIIFQALLGDLSIPELSFDLLKRTAGVLFFSCWFNEWDLPRLLSLPERSKIFRKSVPRSIRRGKLVEAFYKLETAQETKSNMERTHKDGQLKYGSPRSVDLFLHSIFTTVICYHSTKPPCVLDFDNHSINYEWLVDSVKPNMLHFTVNSDHTGLLYFAPIDEAFQRVLDGVQRALTVWGILNEIKNPSAPVQRQQLCLQLGKEVDVDTKDFRHMSALNLSVRLSSHFLTTHLLHRGADPNITDRELNTPLHYAAVGRRRASRLRIWNQLTQIGALNFKNALGITPVDIVQDNPGLNLESFAKEPWLRANFPSVANDELLASTTRHIYIIEIYKPAENRKRDWWGTIMSVHDLLYSQSYWKELLHHRRTPWLHSLTPVYTWLHVPEHNIAWIEDLCITLRLSGMWAVGKSVLSESIRARTVPSCVQKSCNGWASFIPYISYEENRTHLARAKYLRVVEHQCKIAPQQTVTPSHTETQHDKNPAKNSPHPNSSVTSTDFRGIGQGEEATHSETSTGRDICEEEKALMRAYWHDPPTLAVRRTLDQYYYHMLDTEAARDQDQVVARWAQVKGQTAHKILMVDQIWIWTNTPRRTGEDPRDVMYDSLENVNQSPEQYLLTACPFSRSPQSSSNSAGVGHLLEALSNMKNWESGTTENLEVASAISHLMTICFGVQNGFHNDNGFQFMRIFEDSIAVIDDTECKLSTEFQRLGQELHSLTSKSQGTYFAKQVHLERLLDIREEIKLLVEIRDIRDEIKIILSVVRKQQEAMEAMREFPDPSSGAMLGDSLPFDVVKANLDDFIRLDSQALAVQDRLNTLMDLKQKASNAWEARSARECAIEAGRQGHTMLVFTIVTSIFLPLSFMCSFLALDIASFPKDKESKTTSWPLGRAAGYLLGFSISVSIPLIYVAINVQAFADLCQYLHYRFLLWIWIAILALLPRSGSCETWLRECREARDLYLKSRNESDKNKVSEKVGKPSDQPSSKDRSESSNQHNETESAENPQSRGWNWTRLRSRASKGEREKVETEV